MHRWDYAALRWEFHSPLKGNGHKSTAARWARNPSNSDRMRKKKIVDDFISHERARARADDRCVSGELWIVASKTHSSTFPIRVELCYRQRQDGSAERSTLVPGRLHSTSARGWPSKPHDIMDSPTLGLSRLRRENERQAGGYCAARDWRGAQDCSSGMMIEARNGYDEKLFVQDRCVSTSPALRHSTSVALPHPSSATR